MFPPDDRGSSISNRNPLDLIERDHIARAVWRACRGRRRSAGSCARRRRGAPVRPAADKRLGPYLPWIDDRRVDALVIARVAGQDGQPVAERRRCDDQIGLREGMPRLAAFLDQQPPFEYDVFGDGQDALLEHRSHFVREPIVEFGALARRRARCRSVFP
jgi:hypothetical protein